MTSRGLWPPFLLRCLGRSFIPIYLVERRGSSLLLNGVVLCGEIREEVPLIGILAVANELPERDHDGSKEG